ERDRRHPHEHPRREGQRAGGVDTGVAPPGAPLPVRAAELAPLRPAIVTRAATLRLHRLRRAPARPLPLAPSPHLPPALPRPPPRDPPPPPRGGRRRGRRGPVGP